MNSQSARERSNRLFCLQKFAVDWAIAAALVAVCAPIGATSACGQQVVPFGDVPATTHFPEMEIASRGQHPIREITYSPWRKLCFRAVQDSDVTMVCRTAISGKWDNGQTVLKVDLIERESNPNARLQIFVPPGLFLQPGIKATVDNGTPVHVPYVICLANGCVAGTVAEPAFLRELETGRTLALEAVNPNVLTIIASLRLDDFAKARQGTAAQIFEQRLEGDWEHFVDEGDKK
jgi:invasion protein IalB